MVLLGLLAVASAAQIEAGAGLGHGQPWSVHGRVLLDMPSGYGQWVVGAGYRVRAWSTDRLGTPNSRQPTSVHTVSTRRRLFARDQYGMEQGLGYRQTPVFFGLRIGAVLGGSMAVAIDPLTIVDSHIYAARTGTSAMGTNITSAISFPLALELSPPDLPLSLAAGIDPSFGYYTDLVLQTIVLNEPAPPGWGWDFTRPEICARFVW